MLQIHITVLRLANLGYVRGERQQLGEPTVRLAKFPLLSYILGLKKPQITVKFCEFKSGAVNWRFAISKWLFYLTLRMMYHCDTYIPEYNNVIF